MIIKQRIKDFEKMGLGVFVHFGIYSVLEQGEWVKFAHKMDHDGYEALAKDFCPQEGWAAALAQAAKGAGAKYITLTARHHDGFSLYDTQGLDDFDAPHFCGRDLVGEFVDACRAEGLVPFFYHTLLDWHRPEYKADFPAYLRYLRASVEKLCANYGPIGGIWFDGMWDNFSADWEEDALYHMIRSYQPEAMIINNTGMDARGALGHIELDSVTFECGKPQPINLSESPKYIASEMCQTMNGHWGYAAMDLNYKSMADILRDLAACRRCGANYLLNVGPKPDGSLRLYDQGILEALGLWVRANEEAVRAARPSEIPVRNRPEDFLLQGPDGWYLFVLDAPLYNNPDGDRLEELAIEQPVRSVTWLDNGEALPFCQEEGLLKITALPYRYGTNTVVRVAKITCA